MGVFDERRDEQRLERGFQAAMLLGGAGLVVTFYLWFRGMAGVGGVAGLVFLCAGALGLGFRLREGSVAAATGLLVVAAVGLLLSVLIRPFTFDLLSLLVIFLLLRARQAARSVQLRGVRAGGSP
jgi:hypothetical protein